MSASHLDLKLSSALSVPAYSTEPSISKDGRFVYAFFANGPGLPLAQIYENVDGALVLRHSIDVDPEFPFPFDGFANEDFTLFSVVDVASTGPPFTARIRIFDANLNTLVSRVAGAGDVGFGNGGYFSPDGRYVTFGFSVFTSATTTATTMDILRTSDLSTVSTTVLPGFDINASVLFDVKGKLFLSYQETNGIPITNDNEPVQLPINSSVYRVEPTGLVFVDSKPLPKFAEKSVVSYGKRALIAHGGFCSLFPDQTSIYDSNVGITTYQPNDNAEARVFQFNGNRLELVVKQAVNCCNRTVIYPPGKGCSYLIGQNTLVGQPPDRVTDREFFSFASLVKVKCERRFRGENLAQQDAFHAIPVFSRDGKWLFRLGTYGYAGGVPTDDAVGIHNVLLYRVVNVCEKHKS